MSNFFSFAIQDKNQSVDLMCLAKQHAKEKLYPWFRQHHGAFLLLARLPNHRPFGQGPNWISEVMVSQSYWSLHFDFLPKTPLKGNVLCGSKQWQFWSRTAAALERCYGSACQTEVLTILASSLFCFTGQLLLLSSTWKKEQTHKPRCK